MSHTWDIMVRPEQFDENQVAPAHHQTQVFDGFVSFNVYWQILVILSFTINLILVLCIAMCCYHFREYQLWRIIFFLTGIGRGVDHVIGVRPASNTQDVPISLDEEQGVELTEITGCACPPANPFSLLVEN